MALSGHMLVYVSNCLITPNSVFTVPEINFGAAAAWSSDRVKQNTNSMRVADYLLSLDEVSIFQSALQASRHWSTITKSDSISVFVPTDDALQNEGSAFLLSEVLVKPENSVRLDELAGIHIVASGLLLSREFGKSGVVETLSKHCIAVQVMDLSLIHV